MVAAQRDVLLHARAPQIEAGISAALADQIRLRSGMVASWPCRAQLAHRDLDLAGLHLGAIDQQSQLHQLRTATTNPAGPA
jgi:hypothetical protein